MVFGEERGILTQGDWRPFDAVPGFCDLIGPIWKLPVDSEDEIIRLGFRVEPRHCNRLNWCHGGMVSTMCDTALGINANLHAGIENVTPTVSLSVDFIRGARLGEWVESRVRILRMTASLVFVDGLLRTECGVTARANGVFKRR